MVVHVPGSPETLRGATYGPCTLGVFGAALYKGVLKCVPFVGRNLRVKLCEALFKLAPEVGSEAIFKHL